MNKLKRTVLIGAALALMLAAVFVPAGMSFNGLNAVHDAVAAIQTRNTRVTATRELLDQFSEIQSTYLSLLLNIDTSQRDEINRKARELSRFNSPLDRVMTVSADFLPAERQVALWDASTQIVASWENISNSDLSNLTDEERALHLLQINENVKRVRKIVDEIDAALARDNNGYIEMTLAKLGGASSMLIVIIVGSLFLGVLAAASVVLVFRNVNRAARDIRHSEAKLAHQNSVLKAAIDNMSHGLSMYDADYGLDVINRRFLEIYGFSEDEVWAGISVEEIKKIRAERGYRIYSESGEKIVDVFKTTRAANGEIPQSEVDLERDIVVNGRIIRVTRTPREGGGWVVMHADITERRRALMALEVREREPTEQNQRFKDLVEGTPYGMSMFDNDHRLVVCNQRYIELYGIAEIDPRPGTTFEDITDCIFDNKTYLDSSDQTRLRFKNGAVAPKSASKVYEFSDGRSIHMSRFPRVSGGWVAIHEDVTERLKIEREFDANKAQLALQNELFRDALENMGQGLSMYDQDNRLLVRNERYLKIYNLQPGDAEPGTTLRELAARLLRRSVDDIQLDEYVARFYAPHAERKSFSRILTLADGRFFQVNSHVRPEGGWVVIHDEVTEREQARHELEVSERAQRQQSELFKDALDNMGYGLNVFDAKGRILVYNKQYLEMAGLAEGDLTAGITGVEIVDLRKAKGLSQETGKEFVQQHYEALRNNEYFEHIQTSIAGQVIASAYYPRAIGGWVVLHRDITEILQAENEVRLAAEESEKLRQQEQAAVASNQAKSAFLAMMSHEIRTPMNAVIGLSSALLGSDLSADQHHIVETIHESSNSLLRLLNDILDISKLDAGKVEFEAAPFSLNALLDQVASIVETKAVDKGLSLRTSIGEDIPRAMVGDQTRIRQVVLNLMTNAIKFTESGFVEVAARCLDQKDGKAAIELVVRDTGIGIAPEHVDKLFSEFSQADSSINRRIGGTGLGLAISKRIIEQMDGEIRVDSVLAVGTTFKVMLTLPVADESALAERHGRKTINEFVALLRQAERPLDVLLAEDNVTNQLVFSKLMQDCNVKIVIAENGRRALDLAREGAFDIVFMDMRMPEMDGLEASRAIRALGGAWAKIPIVALTANAFADDVRACREAGMDEFLSKPIRKATLLEMLAKVLHDHPLLVGAFTAVAEKHRHIHEADMAALPMTPPAEVALTDVAPIFDRAAFDTLVQEIDADGVRMTFDVFLAETGQRLALMRQLSCERDRKRIRDEAHTLKGAAGTFALRQVQELSKTLEQTAPAIAPEAYADIVDRIEAAFAVGCVEVEAALAAALASSAN
jgi:signal transduction histidine kinase/DNA-binding NarL/FixJ family response regulator/HPt (histidine-containing phosphotransfer) domain-containing protein